MSGSRGSPTEEEKMSRINELLQISEVEIEGVRKVHEKTEEDIEKDLDMLLDWLEKQPHLPMPHDRDRLERILLRNKFRMEQAKSKLDHYYTFKILYPEFYALNPESTCTQKVRKSVIVTPMPKLLPSLERLYCCQFVKDEEDNCNMLDLFQYLIMFWELQLSHDYSSAEVYLWDFKYFTFKHLLKMDINYMQKGFTILRQAFSGRISRVHYINMPSSLDVIMNIMGRVMDAKLLGKIKIHKDMDSLYEVVPKKYLPDDFGGSAGSMADLCDEWNEELKLQMDFFDTQRGNTSDESLRIGQPMQNDLFGVEGTFKRINLD